VQLLEHLEFRCLAAIPYHQVASTNDDGLAFEPKALGSFRDDLDSQLRFWIKADLLSAALPAAWIAFALH
jgi:hypothetical protein